VFWGIMVAALFTGRLPFLLPYQQRHKEIIIVNYNHQTKYQLKAVDW